MAFDLGAMLKDVPKLDTGREQIEYIRLDLIDEDPNNFYQLSGIEELANNIATCGLQQPIRVRNSSENPDRYVIVSGHRRRKAVELLAQDEPDRWNEVACIVEQDSASPALQQLRLIYANSNTRTMTPAEVSEQAAQVEKLLYQLKEEGYEFPGRMRDHVAAAVGASKSKLARLKVIREKLAACWRGAWERSEIGESVAYALAQRPVVWQGAIYSNWGAYPNSLTSDLVPRFCVRFENIAKIQCVHGQELCSHAFSMMTRSSKESWTSPCTQCCFDCPDLSSCKDSCPKAAAKKKELKAAAKQEEGKLIAEQEERDRPGAEFARMVYERVGLARKASGATVKDLYEAQRKIYSSSIDDPTQLRLEKGNGKWSPHTYLPFGYSMEAASAMVICKVADTLGCSVDYLLGRTDVMDMAQATPSGLEHVPNSGAWHSASEEPPVGISLVLIGSDGFTDIGKYIGCGKYSVDYGDPIIFWSLYPENTDVGMTAPAVGWRTGTPGAPGTYAAYTRIEGVRQSLIRELYWNGEWWAMHNERIPDDLQIQCWIPKPEVKRMSDLQYQVFAPSGEMVLHAPESCRYPPRTELSLLEAGYTIRLNGKRLTKTEIKKRGDRK